MKVTLAQTEKLLTGSAMFTQFGFSMLITKLRRAYANDPVSLPLCTKEINMYLTKFQATMTQDYEKISNL